MMTRRTVAVLAVVGGAYEIVNAIADASASAGALGGGHLLAVLLGVLMGLLLAVAGAAALRSAADAARVARGAALACLALVVGLQLGFPFMSIFARLLGAGLPVALLLVTRRPPGLDGRDGSVPAVA